MLKFCAWHYLYFPDEVKGQIEPRDYPLGEVEPLDNKKKSHGICDRCLEKQLKEIEDRR